MFAVPSPAQSGKGGTQTLALKVCTAFEENKDLRRVVDECFGNANSVDWNMHDQTHDITMSKMTPFDLTPEMANELAKYMIMAKAYDRVALPMFARYLEGKNFNAFDGEAFGDFRRPKLSIQVTNKMYDGTSYLGTQLWVWGMTYPFRSWFKDSNEPGHGECHRNIQTPEMDDQSKIIGTAWAWDASFDMDGTSLAEYLEVKFGADVTEYDKDVDDDLERASTWNGEDQFGVGNPWG